LYLKSEKLGFVSLLGTSEVLCHAAIERIYGEKAREVVDGIMRHPTSVLPIVLKRLKQKV
jgi:paired amphipathic helix protein Sin3a